MDPIQELIEQLQRDLTSMTGAQAAATQGLIDSLKRSQRSFGFFDRYLRAATDSTEGFAEYIDRGSESADVFSDVLRDSSRREQSRVKQMANAAQGFVDSTLSNIERLGQGSNESASTLQSAAKLSADAISAAMDGVKGIAGAIAPGIGSAIVGIFTESTKVLAQAGSALVGFYAGQMEGLRSQQKKFYEAGIQFAGGIDDAGKIVKDSPLLTLGDLASAAEQARDSLRLMAGGSAGGLKRVSEGFKRLGQTNTEYLYALGYSNDEILSGMSDYAGSIERYGMALDPQALADGSMGYLKNLRDLERLTGADAKTRKAQAEALNANLGFQNAIASRTPEMQKYLTDFVGSMPDSIRTMSQFAAAGKPLVGDAARFAAQVPGLEMAMRDIMSATSPEELKQKLASYAPELKEATEKLMEGSIGDVALYASEAGGPLQGIAENGGNFLNWIRGVNQQIAQGDLDFAKMQGPLQDGINDFVLETKRMENIFQGLALQLTGSVSPAIQGMVDGFRDVASIFGIELGLMVGEVQKEIVSSNVIKSLQSLDPEGRQALGIQSAVIDPGSKGQSGSMQYQIKPELLEKAEKAGLTYEETLLQEISIRAQAKQKEIEANKEALAQEKINFLQSQGISEIRKVTEEEIKTAIDQNNTALAERLKIEKELFNYFNTNTSKLSQFNLERDNGSFWTSNDDKFKLKPNAKGAIVPKNPTGGQIMRMSEVGDEAIMPLTRASGGDLGVKVTGQLIDNSMLMKSLLDVTKNQASMIAGLNSQMSNMNSNFEKLVYEQRQANRLAV